MVVEVACRARALTASETYRMRSAWCGVVSIASISPLLLPQTRESDEVFQAVPEVAFEQPRGMRALIFMSVLKTCRPWFVAGLARKIGTEPYDLRSDFDRFLPEAPGAGPARDSRSPEPSVLATKRLLLPPTTEPPASHRASKPPIHGATAGHEQPSQCAESQRDHRPYP